MRNALVMVTTHAQVAIANREQGLRLRKEPCVKFRFDDFPFIDRVNVNRRIERLMTNHG